MLHRHRIKIGALASVNPELTRLALEVADSADRPAAGTDALGRFLEALSAYGSADLRADLRPLVGALKAR